MIPMQHKTTTNTPMLPDSKRFLHTLSTSRAILRCELRRDFPHSLTSLFRFVEQDHYKKPPSRITDRFRKAMVLDHPCDIQIFYSYIVELFYDCVSRLLREVSSLICYLLMFLCKLSDCFLSILSSLLFLADFTLRYPKFSLRLFKVARIFYHFAGRERGVVLYANIYADRFARFRQRLRPLILYCEDDEPAIHLSFDSTGLYLPFDLTTEANTTSAYTREPELIRSEFESGLRVGERIKTISRFETRIAGLLARFHTAKEVLISVLEFLESCLQHLRMHTCNVRPDSTNFRQFSTLLSKTNRLASDNISIASFLQRSIVEFAAGVKGSLARSDEFFIRSYLELIGFQSVPCTLRFYILQNRREREIGSQ